MQWTDEPDDKALLHQALVLEPSDPLLPAYVEYWKRILSDGYTRAAASDWTALSIDIVDRQVEGDDLGYMHAAFRNGVKKPARGLGQYYVRGEAFDCIQPRGEDNKTFNRRQTRWLLKHYHLLNEAANSAEVQPLLERIASIRPLPVSAATSYGWFNLQLGHDSFGSLPSEDQAMLEDRDPPPVNPLKELMTGILEFE